MAICVCFVFALRWLKKQNSIISLPGSQESEVKVLALAAPHTESRGESVRRAPSSPGGSLPLRLVATSLGALLSLGTAFSVWGPPLPLTAYL